MLSRLLSRKHYFPFFHNVIFFNFLIQLVGTTGFEPATPCPPEIDTFMEDMGEAFEKVSLNLFDDVTIKAG